jgi:hypothetical protein
MSAMTPRDRIVPASRSLAYLGKAPEAFAGRFSINDFSAHQSVLLSSAMKSLRCYGVIAALMMLSGCSHQMTMKSLEGVTYDGRYRFGRDDSGLMQIYGPENEILIGRFVRVGRTHFVESYEKTFGRDTIALAGPDLSRHAGSLGGVIGPTSGFHETAYADPAAAAEGKPTKSISGPLFYWVASLQGDRRTVLGCFLIGSSYTGGGFGRCKSQSGQIYDVDF